MASTSVPQRGPAGPGGDAPRPARQRPVAKMRAMSSPFLPSGTRAARAPVLGSVLRVLAGFRPARTRVDGRERARASAGAAFGILAAALIARAGGASLWPQVPWLAAPLGASAVLVFAVPASPLAQPWPVIGGNVLSALVGSLCAAMIGDPAWACAVGVGTAILVMFACRCLHPPGGATALLVALNAAGPQFALFPMLVDSTLLVAAGILYNSLTGRRYPHAQGWSTQPRQASSRFTAADLDAALAHYNQVIDVSPDDLEEILRFAEASAYQRNFGHLICGDVMTRDALTAEYGTPLDQAWRTMRARHIKALPVIDRARRIVGIVTVSDFMQHAGNERHDGLAQRLRALLHRDGRVHSSKPEVVGQIMTPRVRVVSADRPLAELVPLFAEAGHHHIPVIDREQRLAGIITQSDLVRALHTATRP